MLSYKARGYIIAFRQGEGTPTPPAPATLAPRRPFYIIARSYGHALIFGRTAKAAGSATDHPTSGALAASLSTIAGTAARTRLHSAAGTLVADASTVVGAASRKVTHATSGDLLASASTILGAASVGFPQSGQGNLSFEWPPRKKERSRKRTQEIEGLREELEEALGLRPKVEPVVEVAAREWVRQTPPPELARALRNLRKLPDTASELDEIAKLRVAVQEAQAAVAAETVRRTRRRKQQQQILLLS